MKNEKKPKIAVIGLKGLPAFGGAAAVGENIIEQLKDKYDFTVYSISSHTNLKSGDYNGYKQIVLKLTKRSGLSTLKYYFWSVFHTLFYCKYDLIHLHHNAALFLLPFLRLKYKVILTTHGVQASKFSRYTYIFDFFNRACMPFANIITAVSKLDYDAVIENKRRDVYYIPNGANTPSINKNVRREIKEPYILFAAGRIIETKGCHLFLEAVSTINYLGKIVIVGDPTHDEKQEKIIFEYKKQNPSIVHLGLIKDKDRLNHLLINAELFVYPSFVESMSMMLLEVASLGVPCICADIRANRDIFSENEITFSKANDVDSLRKQIKNVLENYTLAQKKAENALEVIKKNHNWLIIADQYDELYKKLI